MKKFEDIPSEKRESVETAHLEEPSVIYKETFIEALQESYADSEGERYRKEDIEDFKKDFDVLLRKIRILKSGDAAIFFAKVPQSEYWLINNNKYIGRVTIRPKLSPKLEKIGGHIGYDIRTTERNKGYGKKILELGLEKARGMGLERVLITCFNTNVGSKKIIENQGGVLENEIPGNEGGLSVLRYWIDLTK